MSKFVRGNRASTTSTDYDCIEIDFLHFMSFPIVFEYVSGVPRATVSARGIWYSRAKEGCTG